MLSIQLNSSTCQYLSIDNGVTMTSKRRENTNLVSFICLSFLVISFSKQLLMNLIVRWCLFARIIIKSSISFLSSFHSEKISSMHLFHSSGFVLLKLIISVSTDAIKMFAKATAIFVPMGFSVSLSSKEFS